MSPDELECSRHDGADARFSKIIIIIDNNKNNRFGKNRPVRNKIGSIYKKIDTLDID